MEKEEFKKQWDKVDDRQKTIILDNGAEICTDGYGFSEGKGIALEWQSYVICGCKLKSIKEVR